MHRLVHALIVAAFAAPASGQFLPGDLFVKRSREAIGQYRGNGTFVTSLGDETGVTRVCAEYLDDGTIATARIDPYGIIFLDASGVEVRSFDTPEIISRPGDIAQFADGTLVVGDEDGGINLYTTEGTHVATYTAPTEYVLGLHVDDFDHLWICDATERISSDSGTIIVLDRSGLLLDMFDTDFEARDLVRDPDGTLWVAKQNGGDIVRLTPDGSLLARIKCGLNRVTGIALGVDDTLWVGGPADLALENYTKIGRLITRVPLGHPATSVYWMSMVPGDRRLRATLDCPPDHAVRHGRHARRTGQRRLRHERRRLHHPRRLPLRRHRPRRAAALPARRSGLLDLRCRRRRRLLRQRSRRPLRRPLRRGDPTSPPAKSPGREPHRRPPDDAPMPAHSPGPPTLGGPVSSPTFATPATHASIRVSSTESGSAPAPSR